MARGLPFRTRADFESYLTRIEQYPRLNDQALAITANAVRGGFVLPCSVLNGYERTISGVIAPDPHQSRFYEPFAGARPATITEADWAALQARARTIITTSHQPGLSEASRFLHARLSAALRANATASRPSRTAPTIMRCRSARTRPPTSPRSRSTISASREVARIRGEMERVAREAGYPTREAFIQELRTNPRYFATTPEQLIQASAAINKEVDGHLPRLFGTAAAPHLHHPHHPGRDRRGHDHRLLQPGLARERHCRHLLCERLAAQPAAALGDPGAHRLHESRARPSPPDRAPAGDGRSPPFRRNFTSFTAFTEGWALYAESLGEEMGLYNTPAAAHGRAHLPDVARLPAGGRHRHPRLRLGQGAGDRLHARAIPRSPTPISRPR